MNIPHMTVTAAATMTGRHRETLLEALRGRELHGFQRRKGANWYMRPECIEAWIEARPCGHQSALTVGQ